MLKLYVHFTGLEVVCVILRRLSYPCRYLDLELFFGRPRTEICRLFLAGTRFLQPIVDRKLSNFNQPWLSLNSIIEYQTAVQDKLFANNAPPFVQKCPWGFIDGTVLATCKPQHFQRATYNGHKRVHGYVFQSLLTPNGLIANLFGPLAGRRHDSGMLAESRLLQDIQGHCNYQGKAIPIYGDKGYPGPLSLTRLCSAYA